MTVPHLPHIPQLITGVHFANIVAQLDLSSLLNLITLQHRLFISRNATAIIILTCVYVAYMSHS